MCDVTVDDYLAALEFIPDCFFRYKMLEKLDNALHANNDILTRSYLLLIKDIFLL